MMTSKNLFYFSFHFFSSCTNMHTHTYTLRIKTDKLISREPSTENEQPRPSSMLFVNSMSPTSSHRSSVIKKKAASFLQRGVKKPILTRSQVSFWWMALKNFYVLFCLLFNAACIIFICLLFFILCMLLTHIQSD